MNYTIKEERLTAEEYIEFLKHTDLGVVRQCTGQGIGTALVKKLHEAAGGSCTPASTKMPTAFTKSWGCTSPMTSSG
jgi:hypothetical protein